MRRRERGGRGEGEQEEEEVEREAGMFFEDLRTTVTRATHATRPVGGRVGGSVVVSRVVLHVFVARDQGAQRLFFLLERRALLRCMCRYRQID